MAERLKVMTVVGTRPEVIRLSRTIAQLDRFTDHVLVHTGQNHDYELNEIFFDDLEIRAPDIDLNVDTDSLGAVLGGVLKGTERALLVERPDAMLILGDTNSSIAALMARRHQVPVYHLEAGNRSFDDNVPEEVNRRLVDHIADYNLAYTEHARRNLLAKVSIPPASPSPDRRCGRSSTIRARPSRPAAYFVSSASLRVATSWSASIAKRTSTSPNGCDHCSQHCRSCPPSTHCRS